MKRIKKCFYHSGSDNQAYPDVTISFRRVDVKNISTWSEKEKQELESFMEECEKSFHQFKSNIAFIIKQSHPTP